MRLAGLLVVTLSMSACTVEVVVPGLPSSAGAETYHVDPGASLLVSPGTQAGYGITAAVGGGSFRLVWTGEAATTGFYSNFTGTVWTTATFDSVTPGCAGQACSIESGDFISGATAVSGGQRIDFDAVTTTGLDGFDFTVTADSASTPVYFDLYVDGVRQPQAVFFASGGATATAATDPFGLTSQ